MRRKQTERGARGLASPRTYRAFAATLLFVCFVQRAAAQQCDPSRFDTLIRFEWRRSFDSDIDVCVGKRGDLVTLLVTRHARDGTLTLRRERRLAANDWTKLVRTIMSAHLENVKTTALEDAMRQADGSTWRIRVESGPANSTAKGWTPSKSDATRVVGEAMLDLAGRDVVDGDVY